jgi:hypothetical protein
MPARDKYHGAVRNALINDSWTITDDPFRLKWGGRDFFIDLAAKQVLAAEKAGKRIAVQERSVSVMVVDIVAEEIKRWIP